MHEHVKNTMLLCYVWMQFVSTQYKNVTSLQLTFSLLGGEVWYGCVTPREDLVIIIIPEHNILLDEWWHCLCQGQTW